jgi:hypothetical protein
LRRIEAGRAVASKIATVRTLTGCILARKILFFRESDFQGRMLWLLELSSHFHFGSGGVRFPDMEDFEGNEAKQNNLIMPEPCALIKGLPPCSIIRPILTPNAGAMHALHAFSGSGIFSGQSQTFLSMLSSLASAADAAQRGF